VCPFQFVRLFQQPARLGVIVSIPADGGQIVKTRRAAGTIAQVAPNAKTLGKQRFGKGVIAVVNREYRRPVQDLRTGGRPLRGDR